MPRANPFQGINDVELTFARKFAIGGLAGIGVSLEEVGDGTGLLKNTKSGSTYGVMPCPVVDGRIMFYLDANKGLVMTGGQPAWFLLVNSSKSVIHMVPRENFIKALEQSIATKHAGLLANHVNGYLQVHLHEEWAASVGLITKTIKGKLGKHPYLTARGVQMATDDQFGHLHVHSMYSMLDGASTIEGLAQRTAENGQKFCALTDHGFMFGTWKFYRACKDWGVKPLLGCEVYLVDDVNKRYQRTMPDGSGTRDARFEYHQTIIAMNQTGWENLCTLVSKACRDHFYYVPRIDHKMLFEHNEGLIVLSGCFKGPVAWHLQEFEPPKEPGDVLPHWYRTDPDHSYNIARQYRQVLGDRYYIEMQSNDFARYMKAMPRIAQLSDDLGIPALVTNDCHFEVEEDAIFQAMLTKINSGTKVDNLGDELRAKAPYYMKMRSEIETHGIFQSHHFTRTCEVADRCTLDFPKGFLFPKYDVEKDEHWAGFQKSKVA